MLAMIQLITIPYNIPCPECPYFNETGLCNHFFLSATLPHFLHTNFGSLTMVINLSNFSDISSSFHLQSRFTFLAIWFPYWHMIVLRSAGLIFALHLHNELVPSFPCGYLAGRQSPVRSSAAQFTLLLKTLVSSTAA